MEHEGEAEEEGVVSSRHMGVGRPMSGSSRVSQGRHQLVSAHHMLCGPPRPSLDHNLPQSTDETPRLMIC